MELSVLLILLNFVITLPLDSWILPPLRLPASTKLISGLKAHYTFRRRRPTSSRTCLWSQAVRASALVLVQPSIPLVACRDKFLLQNFIAEIHSKVSKVAIDIEIIQSDIVLAKLLHVLDLPQQGSARDRAVLTSKLPEICQLCLQQRDLPTGVL